MPPEPVTMRSVFEWTCDDCGRDNICRPLESHMDEEEIRSQMELDPWEELPDGVGGVWFSYPTEVTCKHCDATYETADPEMI